LPDVLPKDYNATFQQARFLVNSPELADILKPAPGGAVEHLASLDNPSSRVREAFLTVYGRWPDDEEALRASAFLEERPGQTVETTRDLLWAMMTSAEFLTMP
jgi:hypothetical protein